MPAVEVVPSIAESMPVKLMAIASGIVISVGEIFGGGNRTGHRWRRGAGGFGIQYALYLAEAAMRDAISSHTSVSDPSQPTIATLVALRRL